MVFPRIHATRVLLLAACVAPVQARADAELNLGVETAAEYDDNALVVSGSPQSDFVGSLGPRLELRDPRGELQYELRYYPSYEKFLDLSELDGWNHDALVSVTWQAGERTSLRVRDHYIETNRAATALAEGVPADATGDVPLVLGQRGFTRNIASGEILHRLTYLDDLSLTAQNVLSETDPFEGLSVTEGDVTTLGLSWLRSLSARTRAGMFVRYTRQTFEDLTFETESRSDFYNASFQWAHHFDPTWSLSISAGPTWVSSEAPDQDVEFRNQPLYPVVLGEGEGERGPVLIDSCPTLADGTRILAAECEVFPDTQVLPGMGDAGFVFRQDLARTTDLGLIGDLPDSSSDGLTYFAAVALTKEWRTLSASLRYSRDASTTAAVAGSVRDVLQGNLDWNPTDRLRITFVASWEQREQETTGVAFDRRALAPASAVVLDPSQPLGLGVVSIGQSTGILAREINQTVDNQRYTLSLNIRYNLTRRTTLFTRLLWTDQEVDNDAFGVRTSNRFNIVVGVRYYLEPINLPF